MVKFAAFCYILLIVGNIFVECSPTKPHKISKRNTGKILQKFIEILGIGGVTLLAGVGITEYSNMRSQQLEEATLVRARLNCKKNNFGCFDGYCWSNCGPRLSSGDWCFTFDGDAAKIAKIAISNSTVQVINNSTTIPIYGDGKNATFKLSETDEYNNKNVSLKFIPYAKCSFMSECDPCFVCAGNCIKEE